MRKPDYGPAMDAIQIFHQQRTDPDDPIYQTITAFFITFSHWLRRKLVWLASVILTVALACGFAGYRAGYRAGVSDEQLLHTPQGQAALVLARTGVARELLDCHGLGWVAKNGRCYATPVDGRIYGWRVAP